MEKQNCKIGYNFHLMGIGTKYDNGINQETNDGVIKQNYRLRGGLLILIFYLKIFRIHTINLILLCGKKRKIYI